MLLIRLAPTLGLGALTAVCGFNLAYLIPPTARNYLVAALLVLLLSMIILDKEPGWNLALLLAFALTAGALLYWSGPVYSKTNTWILSLTLVLTSIIGGTFLGEGFGRLGRLLFPITIVYLIGWILFLFYQVPGDLKLIWIVTGLILFTLITLSLLIQGKTQDQEDSPLPRAIALFVVIFNLFWLSGLLFI